MVHRFLASLLHSRRHDREFPRSPAPSAERVPGTLRRFLRARARLAASLLHSRRHDRARPGAPGAAASGAPGMVHRFLASLLHSRRHDREFPRSPAPSAERVRDPLGASSAPAVGNELKVFEDLTVVTMTGRVVLENESLAVKEREIVVLMGPSGVGKSVLADAVFGLDKDRGSAVVQIGEKGHLLPPGLGGLVFQTGGGLPHLSVDENLHLLSSDQTKRHQRVKDLELERKLDQKASTLSGGERRRLAFVMQMLAPRRLLWLDEPETGLDLNRIEELENRLEEQKRDGKALVVATHNTDFAMSIADRILYIKGGKLNAISAATGDALKKRIRELSPKPSSHSEEDKQPHPRQVGVGSPNHPTS